MGNTLERATAACLLCGKSERKLTYCLGHGIIAL